MTYDERDGLDGFTHALREREMEGSIRVRFIGF